MGWVQWGLERPRLAQETFYQRARDDILWATYCFHSTYRILQVESSFEFNTLISADNLDIESAFWHVGPKYSIDQIFIGEDQLHHNTVEIIGLVQVDSRPIYLSYAQLPRGQIGI